MTLPEAARDLGVARSTLYAQIALGKLRATKTGRDWSISIEEVARYRAEHLRSAK